MNKYRDPLLDAGATPLSPWRHYNLSVFHSSKAAASAPNSAGSFLAALPTLLEIARDNKIPVVTCTKEDVKAGALFALGASYEELARIAARIAVRILSGENPATMPIAFIDKPDLYWNQGVAERLGIQLAPDIKSKVSVWYKDGNEIPAP